jgi:hypothetical protein
MGIGWIISIPSVWLLGLLFALGGTFIAAEDALEGALAADLLPEGVRGSGVIDNGVEMPNYKLTLASRISPQDCARLGLGYPNPADINISEWHGREDEGILYVPEAGEILYKYRP